MFFSVFIKHYITLSHCSFDRKKKHAVGINGKVLLKFATFYYLLCTKEIPERVSSYHRNDVIDNKNNICFSFSFRHSYHRHNRNSSSQLENIWFFRDILDDSHVHSVKFSGKYGLTVDV